MQIAKKLISAGHSLTVELVLPIKKYLLPVRKQLSAPLGTVAGREARQGNYRFRASSPADSRFLPSRKYFFITSLHCYCSPKTSHPGKNPCLHIIYRFPSQKKQLPFQKKSHKLLSKKHLRQSTPIWAICVPKIGKFPFAFENCYYFHINMLLYG